MALFRILSTVPSDSYYLILSRAGAATDAPGAADNLDLPVRHYSLPPKPVRKWPRRFGLHLAAAVVTTAMSILTRRRKILRILRNEPDTRAVIACSGDLADIPSAFLASRKKGIPFFAYVFDDYVYQWTDDYRLLARWMAPYVFTRCAGVFAPNEFICSDYQQRYGVKTILIRNPRAQETTAVATTPWPAASGTIRILYAGAVYRANYDCFRNLIQALETLPEYHFTLDIFTDQPRHQLEAMGIKGQRVFIHSYAPSDRILHEQRQADILFLPLSFTAPLHEVVRTAAPGKMGEYLGSGRPMLAHVPADSFVAHYVAKHRCGWIADRDDPGSITKELANIINAPEHRTEITRNACRQAQLDFSPQMAGEKLLTSLPSI